METIKVKPWGKDQGEYVLIDAADFDPEKHQKLDDHAPAKKSTKKPA